MVSREYGEAVVEVLDILEHTRKEDIDKIPTGIWKFFNKVKSIDYKSTINHSIPLEKQTLKPKTKAIIAMLYRNYWCSEQEKLEYDKILKMNNDRHKQESSEKYNPDYIFKKNIVENHIRQDEETGMVIVQDEKWYKKIFNMIKNLSKKN